ncbi:MAG: pilus assembly protein PilM [Lentisphaeria bacterium]|nr:pilus assembly protein PilM [Lentisphaeria bacterium]
MFKKQSIVALDIGIASTRMVALETKGKSVKLSKSISFSNSEEGIVGSDELKDHLKTWLGKELAKNAEVVIGLPQFLAITQLSECPANQKSQVSNMVQFETQQMSGLTDESFYYDYRLLKEFGNTPQSVFISVARCSQADERIELIEDAPCFLKDVFLEGDALAATLIQSESNIPENEIHAILDIGAENTTLSIVVNKQMVFTSSIMFGGDYFTDEVAKAHGLNRFDAERAKESLSLMTLDGPSPLLNASKTLIQELQVTFESWQTQQNVDLEATPLRTIHLSGGSAKIKGLAAFIGQQFNCECKLLEMPFEELDGDYAVALGLALLEMKKQSKNSFKKSVSLMPTSHKTELLRRKRLPMLAVAFILFTWGIIGVLYLQFNLSNKELVKLDVRYKELQKCEGIEPSITALKQAINYNQDLLQVFATRGNRNYTVIEAVETLTKDKKKEDWFYLLADYNSYYNVEPKVEVVKVSKPKEKKSFFLIEEPEQDSTLLVRAGSLEPWNLLCASGFTPKQRSDQYRNVRALINKLEQSDIFKNVDINQKQSPIDAQTMQIWTRYRMRPFSLLLPLKREEVNGGN